MNISLKKKEFYYLKEALANNMIRIADDENSSHEDLLKTNENYKMLYDLDKKLTRALNKSGRWYLWQLKNPDLPAARFNIKEEWL